MHRRKRSVGIPGTQLAGGSASTQEAVLHLTERLVPTTAPAPEPEAHEKLLPERLARAAVEVAYDVCVDWRWRRLVAASASGAGGGTPRCDALLQGAEHISWDTYMGNL